MSGISSCNANVHESEVCVCPDISVLHVGVPGNATCFKGVAAQGAWAWHAGRGLVCAGPPCESHAMPVQIRPVHCIRSCWCVCRTGLCYLFIAIYICGVSVMAATHRLTSPRGFASSSSRSKKRQVSGRVTRGRDTRRRHCEGGGGQTSG